MKIFRWLVVFIIPLLIISGVIAFAFNFQPLYEYGFQRYAVSKTTGLADSELSKAAHGLINYFNSDQELIDVTVQKDGNPFPLFHDREIQHLKDVKGLVGLDYQVLIFSLLGAAMVAILAIYRKQARLLAAPVFWGGVTTLAGLILVSLVATTNFDAFFTKFHQLSFANDFWLLDPSRDYLIMLFPGGFWQDASIFIAALIGIFAAVVTFIGWKNLRAVHS
ncbi:MAG: TIGR01906 family membrane protein [Dehalogenimonas sp.]